MNKQDEELTWVSYQGDRWKVVEYSKTWKYFRLFHAVSQQSMLVPEEKFHSTLLMILKEIFK